MRGHEQFNLLIIVITFIYSTFDDGPPTALTAAVLPVAPPGLSSRRGT